MNLYKTALSLIICTASASARLSSDEKDSSAVMRELMAKVDSMQSEVASLKADNKALKSKVASLEKRRGLMPDLEGIELPDMSDMDVKGLTDLLGVEVDPSSGGGPLYDLLSGITSTLLGVTNCVGFELEFGRRLSGERRLGGPSGGTCWFGGPDIDKVVIASEETIEIGFDDFGTNQINLFANDEILSQAKFVSESCFSSRSKSAEFTVRTLGVAELNGATFPFNSNFPVPSPPLTSSASATNLTELEASEGWKNNWE